MKQRFFKVNFTRTYSDAKIPPRTTDYQIPATCRDDALVKLGQMFTGESAGIEYVLTVNACYED